MMPRYRLRTLLILLAVLPPVLGLALRFGAREPAALILVVAAGLAVWMTIEAYLWPAGPLNRT